MKNRLLALAAGFVLATLAEASLHLSRAHAAEAWSRAHGLSVATMSPTAGS